MRGDADPAGPVQPPRTWARSKSKGPGWAASSGLPDPKAHCPPGVGRPRPLSVTGTPQMVENFPSPALGPEPPPFPSGPQRLLSGPPDPPTRREGWGQQERSSHGRAEHSSREGGRAGDPVARRAPNWSRTLSPIWATAGSVQSRRGGCWRCPRPPLLAGGAPPSGVGHQPRGNCACRWGICEPVFLSVNLLTKQLPSGG